ncbi:uncharacterized protein At5g01610-like [Primulina tabacum]|uniref:uncharacterized protein At5g01610-like n=1 Tax=Primulina tabacum TaxID=48773 RepID=UPI003F592C70
MAFWEIIFYLSLCVLSANSTVPSAYQVLRQYDFPVGLLPEGAVDYSLNSATGEFSAQLNGSCHFKIENSYELRYLPVIKGVISKGRLQKLSGVTVKVLVVWLGIVEVNRKGENLEFSVGLASANFPARNFDECPQCGGGGLDCSDLREIINSY